MNQKSVYWSLAVNHPRGESAVTTRRSFCGSALSSLRSRLLHLSPWLVSPLTRAGLSGAVRHWVRIPRHLWEIWDISFRPIAGSFPLHPSLPRLLLRILLHGWEDTESCFSRILDLTCTGFEWQNWVQGSAEEGSMLLLLFVWL